MCHEPQSVKQAFLHILHLFGGTSRYCRVRALEWAQEALTLGYCRAFFSITKNSAASLGWIDLSYVPGAGCCTCCIMACDMTCMCRRYKIAPQCPQQMPSANLVNLNQSINATLAASSCSREARKIWAMLTSLASLSSAA